MKKVVELPILDFGLRREASTVSSDFGVSSGFDVSAQPNVERRTALSRTILDFGLKNKL